MSKPHTARWTRQRGQTMALVAISMVSLLAMAALAIDVVTLYSARGQAERSADAAALAAAKVLADSGLTTDPHNVSSPSIWTLASAAATTEATTVAKQNLIAGQTPTVTVTFPNLAGPSNVFGINPQVSVQVTVSNVPTFFARIWSKASNTVNATALAEAYNPSASDTVSANSTVGPNLVRCLKPLLVPNCDPVTHSGGSSVSGCGGSFQTFVSTSDGAISNPGSISGASPSGVIGESFTLTSGCPSGISCSSGLQGPGGLMGSTPNPPTLAYYPLEVPPTVNSCPGCAGGTDFETNLACCNTGQIQCGSTLSLDTADGNPGINGNGATQSAGQCLIHETAPASPVPDCTPNIDQDCLVTSSGPPYVMKAGTQNPLKGNTSNASLAAGDAISTSDSVITLAIYDAAGNTAPSTSNPVQIIGFLQVFVNDAAVTNGTADMQATVLNVTGCGSNPTGSPVAGSGPAVAVRLIHN